MGKLQDITLRKAAPTGKPYKVVDGLRLYVLVTASGSKLWCYDYRFNDQRKTLSFGR